MSGSGREVLPDARKRSGGPPDVRVWLVGPSGCPGVVGTTSQIYESGREVLPDIWEW